MQLLILTVRKILAMNDKITNDPIHGTIQLQPLCVRIIDTPQFQRLRNIKQLGGAYFTYPGASHNRFEHSIGVCHLAGELARHLQNRIGKDIVMLGSKNPNYAKKLKEAKMTDEDVLCIEIAGLCHDLGHGPFSHLFDMLFNKAMKEKNDAEMWKHEDVSREMFKHMIEENVKVKEAMEKTFKDKYQEKVDFILDLITGKVPNDEQAKTYMYEIVANSRNGIDVDKMDYFARDCHGLGMKSNFDQVRYISQCRVMFIDENSTETTIAVRDKEQFNLYELFHTRIGLFRRAYFHKVTKAVEIMFTEALVEADDFIQIPIPGGEHVRMSEAWKHMSAYQKLTDSIFDHILMSEDDKLKKAKKIITRIYKRELYRLVYETEPKQTFGKDFVQTLERKFLSAGLTKDDFTIQEPVFSYGMKDKNPIDNVYFYKKEDDMNCSRMGSPEQVVAYFIVFTPLVWHKRFTLLKSGSYIVTGMFLHLSYHHFLSSSYNKRFIGFP